MPIDLNARVMPVAERGRAGPLACSLLLHAGGTDQPPQEGTLTVLQKLQIRQSEVREAINTLLGIDTSTRSTVQDDELTKLSNEAMKLEPEIRAAILASPDPQETITKTGDSETRERLELRGKTGLADYLRAAVGGSAVSGAAAEFAAACKVPEVGHVPMEIFARSAPAVEERAITPGPAVKGALQPILPYLFERSAAASLGIAMPSVPAGQVQIAKVGTAPPADTLAKDGTAPATAAAVSLVNQSPVRIAGSFEVRVEDLAVMPSLEQALSEAMQGSLSNELDVQAFSGASGELNGLFTQATDVAAASSAETFTTGIARFAALVDGRHAFNLGDLKACIGSTTFALYAGLFANANKGDVSLFDYLSMHLGSIRVSDRVPAVASTAQKGIVVLSASSTPPKIHVWDAMQIVRDPYSGAGVGKVTLTATALVSPLFIPHGTSQAIEVHPKLS